MLRFIPPNVYVLYVLTLCLWDFFFLLHSRLLFSHLHQYACLFLKYAQEQSKCNSQETEFSEGLTDELHVKSYG